MDNLKLHIEKIVKINDEEEKVVIRSFSRFSSNTKVETMLIHAKLFHKLRQQHKNSIETKILSYLALIMAIQIVVEEYKSINALKLDDMSLDEIREISSKKAKLFLEKKFKIKTKRDKLIDHWAVVRSLKLDEKYSFRNIAKYLKKYHRFEVTYGTIHKTWQELENTKKGNENG